MKTLIINKLTALLFIAAILTLSSCGSSGTKKVTTQQAKTNTGKKEEGIAEVTPEQSKPPTDTLITVW